jgi:uncharacterized protein with HEPN domain/predicted nucleotidyltransferase
VEANPINTDGLQSAQVLEILAAHQEELRQFDVKALTLFGSVARDEARSDSDVDLLIEFTKPVGLFTFIRLQRLLEQWLGRTVDLGTPDSLRPELRESVFQETVVAMPPRNWKLRIQDILEAILEIENFTQGMTFKAFIEDQKTVKAVISDITIIGEAARSKHLPVEVQERYPEIPWDEMRGIRNKVVHEYFRIELNILWRTIKDDLPPLVPQLQEILEDEEA